MIQDIGIFILGLCGLVVLAVAVSVWCIITWGYLESGKYVKGTLVALSLPALGLVLFFLPMLLKEKPEIKKAEAERGND